LGGHVVGSLRLPSQIEKGGGGSGEHKGWWERPIGWAGQLSISWRTYC
jgi:hypothetical protein